MSEIFFVGEGSLSNLLKGDLCLFLCLGGIGDYFFFCKFSLVWYYNKNMFFRDLGVVKWRLKR